MAQNQVYLIKSGDGSFIEETEAIIGISGGKLGVGTTAPEASLHVTGDVKVGGNLSVDGTLTTINSNEITVDDKNIELGSVDSPTNITADGGGITLKGTTDKTITWSNATDAWEFSEHVRLADNMQFQADQLRARDVGGLVVGDDAGNGIFIKDGGQVGINQTSPLYDLDVVGSGNFSEGLYVQGNSVLTGSASDLGKWQEGAEVGEIYYTAGNIGVGTENPSSKLHVIGNTLLNGSLTVAGETGKFDVSDFRISAKTINLNYNGADAGFDAGLYLQTNAGEEYIKYNNLNDAWVSSKNIEIDDNYGLKSQKISAKDSGGIRIEDDAGNGVELKDGGNLSVENDLIVSGNLRVEGTQVIVNTETLKVEDHNVEIAANTGSETLVDAGITWGTGDEVSLTYTNSEGFSFSGRDSDSISFNGANLGKWQEGTEAGEIYYNDGNVGIKTDNPGYDLDVNGTIGAQDGAFSTSLTVGGNNVLTGNTSDLGKWQEGTEAGEIYYNDGNVGVKTDNPGYDLDVNGTIGAQNGAFSTSLTVGGNNVLTGTVEDLGKWSEDTANHIYYYGKVGIGTSVPSPEKLHVGGDIYAHKISIGDQFIFDSDGNVGGGTPQAGDVLMYQGGSWGVAANNPGGLLTGEIPKAFVRTLAAGESIHPIEFVQDLTAIPAISTNLEIVGDGEIIPYVLSGVSETGYHAVFAQNIPSAGYKIHTTFGGKDVFWETGINSIYFDRGDVLLSDKLTVSGNLDVEGAAGINITNDLTVGGDLTVNGSTTTINTQELTVEDKNIVIASNIASTSTSMTEAGITWGNNDAVKLLYTKDLGFSFNGGNVGIGTTSPGAKLDIEEDGGFSAIDLHRDFVNNITSDTNTPQLRFLLSDDTESKQAICSFSPQGTEGTDGKFGGNFRLFVADNSGTLQNRLAIDENGNVGIGTGPNYKLDVKGAIRIDYDGSDLFSTIQGPQNRDLRIDIDANHDDDSLIVRDLRDGSERFIVEAGGNVGIGTTNPDASLEIANNDGSSYRFGFNGTSDVYLDADTVYFRTDDGVANLMTSTTTGLGIGTTGPEQKLHIEAAVAPTILIENTDGSASADQSLGAIEFKGNDASTGAGGIRAKINAEYRGVGGATALILSTAAESAALEPRVYIQHNGKVGIGTTSPDTTLHAKKGDSSVKFLQNDKAAITLEAGSFADFHISHDGTTNKMYVSHGGAVGSTKLLTINANDGNVGIGATSPSTLLELKTAASSGNMAEIALYSDGSNNDATSSIFLGQSLTRRAEITAIRKGTGNSHDLAFSTNAGAANPVEAMRIDSSGNVGIGTTSPDAKLNVAYSSGDISDVVFQETIRVRGDWTSVGSGPAITFTNYHSGANDENPDTDDYNLAAIQACDVHGKWSGSLKFFVTPRSDNGGELGGTSLAQAMIIDSGGNVGIGTTTAPQHILDVRSSEDLTTFAGNQTPGVGIKNENTAVNNVALLAFKASQANTVLAGVGMINRSVSTTAGGSKGDLGFYVKPSGASSLNDNPSMIIDSGGNVAIGTTSPSAVLHVEKESNLTQASPHFKIRGNGYTGFHWLNGTAYYIGQDSDGRSIRIFSGSSTTTGVELKNGSNSWATFSDERLKENITNLDSVIDKIKDIRCVSYTRSDVENSKEAIGFIAQDFIGKFDQVLNKSKISDEDEEEYYSIKYTETIPVLMKAIQEQQQIIEDLKSQNESLIQRIENLENK